MIHELHEEMKAFSVEIDEIWEEREGLRRWEDRLRGKEAALKERDGILSQREREKFEEQGGDFKAKGAEGEGN